MNAEGSRHGGVYRFDRFTLDTMRGALLAAGGTEVALRPKAFALLAELVENAGRLMDRDKIMRLVWPGVVVTDDSITQCVKEIRRALGDDEQRLLRTLPRRGFLFAAEVSREDASTATVVVLPEAAARADADSAPPRPAAARPVVVVLPFENIGGDPEQGYFADGLTADLATDLTRFQSLRVVRPRHGAAARSESLPAWSGASGYVVSGGVRRAAGRVRVTAQLEDAETGVQLWAERFDRPLDDLFAVQEELAERIAAHLATQVDHEGMRQARRRAPQSMDAYDLCLRGRDLFGRGTEADTLLAREMFDRAIEADPDYALAHAWQAYTVQRGFSHWWGEPRGPAALPPALALARRAVELEPRSPPSLARLAFILALCRRYDEALQTARRAVRLNPGSFEARLEYGVVASHAGEDPDEGVREVRIAIELDPFRPPSVRYVLGKALLLAGRPEEALEELRWCAARMPDYGLCQQALVVAATEAGYPDEARAALREVLRLGPHWTMQTMSTLWFFRRPADAERFRAAFQSAGLPCGDQG